MSKARRQRKQQRRRRRAGHGVTLRPSARRFDTPPRRLLHYTYTVSEEGIDLPEEADPAHAAGLTDDERQRLHDQIYDDPPAAIARLEALLAGNPRSPLLLNWLSSAYATVGNAAKAEEIAALNYEHNPNYLFARANHAQFCLRRGEVERVLQVFDGKMDLKLMYPHRNVFHISEFLAFAAVAVEYLMRKGEVDAARNLFHVLDQMLPEHPMTCRLRSVVQGSLLLRLAKRLQRRVFRSGVLP